MAITKTRTSIWSAHDTTATGASSWIDLTGGYGATISLVITNGATGPTTVPVINVEVANDYNAGSPNLVTEFGGGVSPDTTNSGVYYWSIEIPIGIGAVRLNVTTAASGGTANTPTASADISNVTAV